MFTTHDPAGHSLYGADWHISNMESYLKFVAGLELSDRTGISMYKNSGQLFKI